jgi:hypothetical protein
MMRLFFGACAAAALISAPALGADMALKAPPMPPEPTWTGWYIGINGGGAFNTSDPFIGSETNGGIPFVSGTWPGFGNFGNLTSSGGFGGGRSALIGNVAPLFTALRWTFKAPEFVERNPQPCHTLSRRTPLLKG